MLLAIDIGNTHIVFGFFSGDHLQSVSRIATDLSRTEDEYAITLLDLLEVYGYDRSELSGAIISSVVPPLSPVLQQAVRRLSGGRIRPYLVGPGLKTGLNIRIDQPNQLGADFVCVSVAALAKYPLPSVVLDFGTATKFSALDKKGSFRGGSILPGIRISMNALVDGTAQLPSIHLETAPASVIGTNTIDCMRAGILYGNAAMADGMIERYRQELGDELTVIATGGHASAILPYCRSKIIYDENLLLEGLRLIYEQNHK